MKLANTIDTGDINNTQVESIISNRTRGDESEPVEDLTQSVEFSYSSLTQKLDQLANTNNTEVASMEEISTWKDWCQVLLVKTQEQKQQYIETIFNDPKLSNEDRAPYVKQFKKTQVKFELAQALTETHPVHYGKFFNKNIARIIDGTNFEKHILEGSVELICPEGYSIKQIQNLNNLVGSMLGSARGLGIGSEEFTKKMRVVILPQGSINGSMYGFNVTGKKLSYVADNSQIQNVRGVIAHELGHAMAEIKFGNSVSISAKEGMAVHMQKLLEAENEASDNYYQVLSETLTHLKKFRQTQIPYSPEAILRMAGIPYSNETLFPFYYIHGVLMRELITLAANRITDNKRLTIQVYEKYYETTCSETLINPATGQPIVLHNTQLSGREEELHMQAVWHASNYLYEIGQTNSPDELTNTMEQIYKEWLS